MAYTLESIFYIHALALIRNKADAQTRKDLIRAGFTTSEMRFAHTWCCGTHEVGCVGFSYTPSRIARTSARGIVHASRLKRGRYSGSPPTREYVRQITYYDTLLYTNTNTYRALYGHRHEDSFVSRKCTTGVAQTAFCFTPGPIRKTVESVEKFERRAFLLWEEK